MSVQEIACPHCRQKMPYPDTRRPLAACPHCHKKFAIKRAAQKKDATTVGGYELIKKIGGGQMGTVYQAKAPDGQIVALKLLNSALAKGQSFIARFHREVEAAKTFDHPFLVKAFDCGEADGYHYYAMEFIDGEDLEVKLRRGETLDEGQTLYVAKCVAEALRFAWERSIVHRDIKPANIMIQSDGRIRLMDMGLAKDVSDDSATVTQAGGVLGSPAYASPQQLEGHVDVDIRADIYAMGTTLFHLTCGRPPFTGDTAGVVAANNISLPLPDPREHNPNLSEPFCAFLKKLTEKKAEDRFQTPAEVLEAIEKVLMGEMPVKVILKGVKRKIKRDKGVSSSKAKNRLIAPAIAVAVIGVIALGLVIMTKTRKKPVAVAHRKLPQAQERSVTRPRSRRPAKRGPSLLQAEYPPLEGVGLEDLFSGKLSEADGQLSVKYDFEDETDFGDWGFRGQCTGNLVAVDSPTLRGRFFANGLKLEADATLVSGSNLSIVLSGDEQYPHLVFVVAGEHGSYLEWHTDKKKSVKSEVITMPFKAGKATTVKLEIADVITASVGAASLKLEQLISGTFSVQLKQDDGGKLLLDNVSVVGTPGGEWAQREIKREYNQRTVHGELSEAARQENLSLAVQPGTRIKLPNDFHELPKWTLQAYVMLYRVDVSPIDSIILLGNEKTPHRVTINGTNRIGVHFKTDRKQPWTVTGIRPLKRGQWHHVAVTNDGSSLRMFLDGELDSQHKVPNDYKKMPAGNYFAGQNQDAYPGDLVFIDDYSISKAVLYEAGFNPKPPGIATGASWLFLDFQNEASGSDVISGGKRESAPVKIIRSNFVRSDLPVRYYESIEKLARSAGSKIELLEHEKWQSMSLWLTKGQKLTLSSPKSFRHIPIGVPSYGSGLPVDNTLLLNVRTGSGPSKEIHPDEVFEVTEPGLLMIQNTGGTNVLLNAKIE